MGHRTPPRKDQFRRAVGLLVAVLSCLLAGCLGLSGLMLRLEAGPEGVRFSHRHHLETVGLSCQECHTLDPERIRFSMPGHDQCLACHSVTDLARPDASCQTCHVQMPHPGPAKGEVIAAAGEKARHPSSRFELQRYRTGAVTFAHGRHDTPPCATCHGEMGMSRRASEDHLPPMALCMSCHDGRQASATCETCHPVMPKPYDTPARLTSLPFPHPEGWERLHGGLAVQNQDSCRLCHQDQSCERCHQTRPPEDHGVAGWTNSMHGRRALLDRERCATCHAQPTCERCHSDAPPTHSPGFLNPLDATANPEGARRHSLMAKVELRSCMTCHVPAADCTQCHETLR